METDLANAVSNSVDASHESNQDVNEQARRILVGLMAGAALLLSSMIAKLIYNKRYAIMGRLAAQAQSRSLRHLVDWMREPGARVAAGARARSPFFHKRES